MLVKASADGKTLLQSGSFHSIINPLVPSEPLKLVYDGLTIFITTKILPESESNKQGVDAFVKNGEVFFVHRVIVPIMNEAVGLVIPAEIGKKSNGLKLFLAWHSFIRKIGENQISVITNFSLYEGA
ncbi:MULTISPECIES: hypothetical protein [Enterobacter cloacae complex]|uniref:hypothetical protein n=1 Tax=Enterobacter cloacae complex TaxID=354276 RepID=UPI0007950449|nr:MULTISPECIES: hypothetical protein [Enterobacter cloacae complex]KZP62684.1 hypothetical protein A3N36_05375 [Enterobacter hormaechei subsp. xiangfangensis]MBB2843640.1 hypothetical protein [Enterobacter ludwigii]MBJ6483859.1 hypothetical protein [Enterobacter hormaechei]MBK4403918.1 hypothetical protein [Enterobacter hormaechei]MCF1275666.1 hypothetical protein [Enterobacter hormaechei]